MGKFSIIVPMYNVEKYIEACIRSVLSQTYSDFELILIDDMSQDRTLEVAGHYTSDKRIKILLQDEHGGVSKARNAGLNFASGEYVVFLDGDDYYEAHHLERLNSMFTIYNCDICITNSVYFATDNACCKFEFFPYDSTANQGGLSDVLHCIFDSKHAVPGSVCLSAYKTGFLKRNKIAFNEYICAEDMDFLISAVSKCGVIKISDDCTYYYRKDNSGACTANYSKEKILSCLYVWKKWYDFYVFQGQLENDFINAALRKQFCEVFLHVQKLSAGDKGEVINYIRRNQYIYRTSFYKTYEYYVFLEFPCKKLRSLSEQKVVMFLKRVLGQDNYTRLKMLVKGR